MSEPAEKPRLPWHQFTIRRIMAAVFWMAVCFGTFTILSTSKPGGKELSLAVGLVSSAIMALSPFVAVGSLFGRPWAGLCLGIALLGVYITCLLAFVRIDF